MAKEARCTNCECWFEVVPVHKTEYAGKRRRLRKSVWAWRWRYGIDEGLRCPGCYTTQHRNNDKRERRDVDPLTGEVLK